MLKIKQSVGNRAVNDPRDVAIVQLALKLHRKAGQGIYFTGKIDGKLNQDLLQSIVRFQFDNRLVKSKLGIGVITPNSATVKELYRKFPARWGGFEPFIEKDRVVFYDFDMQKLQTDLEKEVSRIKSSAHLLHQYEEALIAFITEVLDKAKILLRLDFKSRKIVYPSSFHLSLRSKPNRVLRLLGGNLGIPTIQQEFSLLNFQKKVIRDSLAKNEVWAEAGKVESKVKLKSKIGNYMAGPLYVAGVINGILEINEKGGSVDLDFTLQRRLLLKKQSQDPFLKSYETAYVYGTVIKLYREHANFTDDLSKVWFKEFMFNQEDYDEIRNYLKRKNNIFAYEFSPLVGELARVMTTETYALLADQLRAIDKAFQAGKLSVVTYAAFQKAVSGGDDLAVFLLEDAQGGASKILLKLAQNTLGIITLGVDVQIDISKGIPADEAIVKNIAEFLIGKVPGTVSAAIITRGLNLRLNKRFSSAQQVIITAIVSFFLDLAITYIIDKFSEKLRIEIGSISRGFYREHIKPSK